MLAISQGQYQMRPKHQGLISYNTEHVMQGDWHDKTEETPDFHGPQTTASTSPGHGTNARSVSSFASIGNNPSGGTA
jgi:hypothetical protein